jgi:homocysteine S-methyltransferase
MGTMLYAHGVPFNHCFDEMNLSRPEIVLNIHRAYVEAGAEILETNTFGANRIKLAEHQLADRIREINAAGVALAQQVRRESGRSVYIAASVGPLGQHLTPLGKLTPSEANAAFREQIAALAEAGADLLILETFSALDELREAVLAARAVCHLPIIASATFAQDGRTLLGHTPMEVVTTLRELKVDVIGVNCSTGPSGVLSVIEQMLPAVDRIPLLAQPNAGWPQHYQQRLIYPAAPAYFADYTRRFLQKGVTIIGGCCGTTPEHIRAMRRAMDAVLAGQAPAEPTIWPGIAIPESEPPAPSLPIGPTRLAQKLQQGKFVITVEVDPPKGFNPERILAGARLLRDAGADVINVADSPMARMRMSPWAIAHLIQAETGVETVLHFPTRGRNLLRVQGDLLAAHALGVRNVFVVMGDPPSIGDYPQATDAYDLAPSGLVQLIKERFNQGIDQAGNPIGQPTSFFVGVALSMDAPDPRREIKVFQRKIKAGADFALTQPIYDVEILHRFREQFGPSPIPILVGILPLYNVRHAEFLQNEVPGIHIPEPVLERLRQAANPATEGIRIAQEIALAVREIAQGIYIMPPFGRFDVAAEVMAALRI